MSERKAGDETLARSTLRQASILVLVSVAALLSGSARADPPIHDSPSSPGWAIPAQSAWVDRGWVLEQGASGSWDTYLNGALTASAIKRNGTYYLYYGGACCYSALLDSVTDRAIGVATSTDGIHFSKHPGNPIMTWMPNDSPEEGAASGAVSVGSDGTTVLYYGANTEETATTVNSDARLATSANSLGFTDRGIVLDHDDSSVWGFGDELFPITTFQDGNQWFLYYVPNGSPQKRTLGVAWGPARDQLTHTAAAKSGGSTIPVWGVGGGAAKIDTDTYALFLNDVRVPKTEVRTLSASDPTQLSAPVETYQWTGVKQATVLLDTDTHTWFLYYRNADQTRYGLKTAPADDADTTPPSRPNGLTLQAVDHAHIDLTWNASTDAESGISHYCIYRDGQLLTTVTGLSYRDSGLQELTTYSYRVSAVNNSDLEGNKSAAVSLTTPGILDTTPPSRPNGLTAQAVDHAHIDLTWNASSDAESGISHYRIYRDGRFETAVTGLSYRDSGLQELTTYSYRVSAVNNSGLEGNKCSAVSTTTPSADNDVIFTDSLESGDISHWSFTVP